MKIAIIGFGSIGKRHLSNLLKLGIQDIVLVSTHIKDSTFDFNGYVLPVVSDVHNIIDSIDAMVIANISSIHHKFIDLAINNNIHVYVEKPLVCNLDNISDWSEKVNDKKLVIAVGTQFRFNERLMKLKELLDQNYIGRVISVMSTHGEHLADYHPNEDYKNSYAAKKEECGGILFTQIHHLDYLNWLFGSFSHVYASEMLAPSLDINADAIINYSLVSNESNLQLHGHMNYVQRPKSTKLHVIGDKGEAYWDYEKNSLNVISDNGNLLDESSLERNNMFLMAIKDFLDSIRLSKLPKGNLKSGIESVKIVESIKRSIVGKLVVAIA